MAPGLAAAMEPTNATKASDALRFKRDTPGFPSVRFLLASLDIAAHVLRMCSEGGLTLAGWTVLPQWHFCGVASYPRKVSERN